MIRREQVLTKEVKKYDPDLFVKMGDDRRMYLMRNKIRWDSFYWGGDTYTYSRPDPMVIFALTDDWTPKGKPVDWGLLPLMIRIKEIDSHRSNEIIERINTAMELREEAKERNLQHKVTSFAYDLRTAVKNDFKDFNLSGMDKTDIRVKHDKLAKKKGL